MLRRNMNILIVDDEPLIRKIFERNLNEDGYNLTVCANGTQALDAINSTGFDLVFLDLMLPDISGVDLIKHIREIDDKLPVVITTGLYNSDQLNEAMKYNPFVVLNKPFSFDTINSIVSILSIGQGTRAEVR
jgi:DNA-binding NtrC family response regulator